MNGASMFERAMGLGFALIFAAILPGCLVQGAEDEDAGEAESALMESPEEQAWADGIVQNTVDFEGVTDTADFTFGNTGETQEKVSPDNTSEPDPQPWKPAPKK